MISPYYNENDGKIIIYNGDCLEIMPQLGGDIDIVFTSPPYNAGDSRKNSFVRKKYNENENDNRDKNEYFNWTINILKELLKITKYHIFFNMAEISGNKGITKLIMINIRITITFTIKNCFYIVMSFCVMKITMRKNTYIWSIMR